MPLSHPCSSRNCETRGVRHVSYSTICGIDAINTSFFVLVHKPETMKTGLGASRFAGVSPHQKIKKSTSQPVSVVLTWYQQLPSARYRHVYSSSLSHAPDTISSFVFVLKPERSSCYLSNTEREIGVIVSYHGQNLAEHGGRKQAG